MNYHRNLDRTHGICGEGGKHCVYQLQLASMSYHGRDGGQLPLHSIHEWGIMLYSWLRGSHG
jgi:hypothetical protein